tara:strand:- start:258 stop:590 length:333 start_codon:yes stop_codon:yes gene_type:complete
MYTNFSKLFHVVTFLLHYIGLHIVCSSLIYDDLFRQVRQWARLGFSGPAIQKELDVRFQDIIQQHIQIRENVMEKVVEEGKNEKEAMETVVEEVEEVMEKEEERVEHEKK